jgi:hypothetical protein
MPPASRSKQFWVGNKQFDPIKLGYSTVKTDNGVLFDTAQVGNGNAGHEYGTNLSDADRMAVIEYLKTL